MTLPKVGIIGVSGLVGKAIIDSIYKLNLLDKIDLYLFGTSEKNIFIDTKEFYIHKYKESYDLHNISFENI